MGTAAAQENKAKAAKPRFMAINGGRVHVVTTKALDLRFSKCPVVKKGHDDGSTWGRKKGMSPEAALEIGQCARCQTHAVAEETIEASKTPAQKREDAKRKRDETLEKLKPERKGKGKAKAEPQRRGPKGSRPETMQAKAEEHAKFAAGHGWASDVEETAKDEWTVVATRDGQELKIIWRDGRTVWSRVVLESGIEVRLRNSANWRKHAEGKSKYKAGYQPKSRATGKKALKQQVIDDEAPRKLPFDMDDDDSTIIESLVGRTVTWRNSISHVLESAKLPGRPRNIRMTEHPKSGKRLISFYESQGHHPQHGEMLGGERTVYIEKILRVK